MLNSINNRSISGLLVVAVTLFMAMACSSSKLVKDESGIKIDRVDSSGATIKHAFLRQTGNQLLLVGEIERRGNSRGPIPGHLHVSLINSLGKNVMEADVGYMRRNLKLSFAKFSIKLPIELEPGSTVRITHFNSKTHGTPLDIDVWRYGEQ